MSIILHGRDPLSSKLNRADPARRRLTPTRTVRKDTDDRAERTPPPRPQPAPPVRLGSDHRSAAPWAGGRALAGPAAAPRRRRPGQLARAQRIRREGIRPWGDPGCLPRRRLPPLSPGGGDGGRRAGGGGVRRGLPGPPGEARTAQGIEEVSVPDSAATTGPITGERDTRPP